MRHPSRLFSSYGDDEVVVVWCFSMATVIVREMYVPVCVKVSNEYVRYFLYTAQLHCTDSDGD